MELERLTTGRIFIGTVGAAVVALIIGLVSGDVRTGFDENNIGTFASAVLLILTSLTSFKIYQIRSSQNRKYADPRNIWALMGAGFFYLCLDEVMQLHEKIDRIIHKVAGINETAMTDRIDDFLILAYGLVGLILLYACRREITRIPGFISFLVLGFAIMVVHVGIDTLNLKAGEYVELFSMEKQSAKLLSRWGMVAEETTKMLAEAVLLAGFAHALRYTANAGKAQKVRNKNKTGFDVERTLNT